MSLYDFWKSSNLFELGEETFLLYFLYGSYFCNLFSALYSESSKIWSLKSY